MSCSTVYLLLSIFVGSVLGSVYNTETYSIAPKSERIVCNYRDNKYIVNNVGKINITTKLIYGNAFSWKGSVAEANIGPGERKIFSVYKYDYSYLALKFVNYEDIFALVNAFGEEHKFPEWDQRDPIWFSLEDKNITDIVRITMAESVPIEAKILSDICDYFWGKDGSVWKKLITELEPILDDEIKKMVREGTLELHKARTNMQYLAQQLEKDEENERFSEDYENIVDNNLYNLKNKFTNSDVKSNYLLFPFYTAFINLKVSFFVFGINNQKKLYLTDDYIQSIKSDLNALIYDEKSGAIQHITKTCESYLNHTYNVTYSEFTYYAMAGVRQNCALNGYEHFANWRKVAKNPKGNSESPPVFVYSVNFGRSSANQIYEIIWLKSKTFTPIKDNQVLQIKKVNVYVTDRNTIGGLKVEYLNGESATTGPLQEGTPVEVDFAGKWLMNLTATGTGQVSSLKFGFDDGSSQQVGTREGPAYVFELPCHYIAGFYGTGADVALTSDQLANIVVSYVSYPCSK